MRSFDWLDAEPEPLPPDVVRKVARGGVIDGALDVFIPGRGMTSPTVHNNHKRRPTRPPIATYSADIGARAWFDLKVRQRSSNRAEGTT